MVRATRSLSTRDSKENRRPLLIKRPPRITFETLCERRVPVKYLHWGLHMHKDVCQQTQKLIRELAIRHLDLSIPHWNQPQDKLDFFKREVLLDPDCAHLRRYEDGWAIDILVRLLFNRRTSLRGLHSMVQEGQHDYYLRHMPLPSTTVRPVPVAFKENQSTQDLDAQMNIADSEAATTSSSRLDILSNLFSSVPSLSQFYDIITKAGLSTDEQLDRFLSWTGASRERFIRGILADHATPFEQAEVMEVLDQIRM